MFDGRFRGLEVRGDHAPLLERIGHGAGERAGRGNGVAATEGKMGEGRKRHCAGPNGVGWLSRVHTLSFSFFCLCREIRTSTYVVWSADVGWSARTAVAGRIAWEVHLAAKGGDI